MPEKHLIKSTHTLQYMMCLPHTILIITRRDRAVFLPAIPERLTMKVRFNCGTADPLKTDLNFIKTKRMESECEISKTN